MLSLPVDAGTGVQSEGFANGPVRGLSLGHGRGGQWEAGQWEAGQESPLEALWAQWYRSRWVKVPTTCP